MNEWTYLNIFGAKYCTKHYPFRSSKVVSYSHIPNPLTLCLSLTQLLHIETLNQNNNGSQKQWCKHTFSKHTIRTQNQFLDTFHSDITFDVLSIFISFIHLTINNNWWKESLNEYLGIFKNHTNEYECQLNGIVYKMMFILPGKK